jgi:hypothetical protein
MKAIHMLARARAAGLATLFVVGAVMAMAPEAAHAQAANRVQVDKQLYIVGQDSAVVFAGQLPSCAGSEVTLAFYQRGPASRDNPVDGTVPALAVRVSTEGALQGAVPLPSTIPPKLATVYAGVSGNCLDGIVFAPNGPVLFGLRDEAGNKNDTGTIVIPASVLTRTANVVGGKSLAEALGALTVFADGKQCTEVLLTSAASLDAEGNARIRVGGPAQPAECSREGALLTFKRADGQTLFEKRRFIPGVNQPLANVAPEAPASTGGGATPAVPDTGTGASAALPETMPTNGGAWRAVAAVVGIAAAGAAVMVMSRSRRRMR